MMTRETDVLADVVMNALWLPDRYTPTRDQHLEELNPGKLAREYVVVSAFPISPKLLTSVVVSSIITMYFVT
jgi:hypothetical protein